MPTYWDGGTMTNNENRALFNGRPFLYPDPLSDVRCLDGAVFLYFSGVAVTMPPTPVSDYSEWGADIYDLVIQRQPRWGSYFLNLWDLWQQEITDMNKTLRIMSPLRDRIMTVILSYPADTPALERSASLMKETGFSYDRVLGEVASPGGAAGELMRHLLLEAWLENDEDLERLYTYCDDLLVPDRAISLLSEAYLLRCTPLAHNFDATLLLNNERLLPFLMHLQSTLDLPVSDGELPRDTITWELFRQILTPYLDPITESTSHIIAECLDNRAEEIQEFRNQCERLADRLVEVPADLDRMTTTVERFIRLYVVDEISDLLKIGKTARKNILYRVLGDKAAWAGTLAFIYGAVHAVPTVSIGGAIGALAFIGSSATQSILDYRRTLKSSNYRLIYHLKH